MPKRIDANQSEIVRELRKRGCSVQSLAGVGKGCPDLLVGRSGVNVLLEVKDGSKPPSARRLTEAQVEWHDAWNGKASIVCNVSEALAAVGIDVKGGM